MRSKASSVLMSPSVSAAICEEKGELVRLTGSAMAPALAIGKCAACVMPLTVSERERGPARVLARGVDNDHNMHIHV
jgi:hypothetical protein